MFFYHTSSYATVVLAFIILSVCPSICHTRALGRNQTLHCGYFDTTRKGNHSNFLTRWRRPLHLKFVLKVTYTPLKHANFDRFLLIMSQL